jgi:radical SAM superfamily enzyme YgiQ (UPF0313 family)
LARITFVYPTYENIGVEYLMAVCAAEGHRAELVFYEAGDNGLGRPTIRIDYDELARRVLETSPEFVGYSCVTENYQYQLNCAKAVKKLRPQVVNIFGGVHVSATPQRVLSQPEVDCVAIGEGEGSLAEFLRKAPGGGQPALPREPVDGMVFKRGSERVGRFESAELVDLDALPFSDKSAFLPHCPDMENEYKIMTSRGCPYSCSYCFNSCFRGARHRVRHRRQESVIAELKAGVQKYGISNVTFLDDSFTADERWLLPFLTMYKREIGKPFYYQSIPAHLHDEVINSLAEAGCVLIEVGVQSLSQEISRTVLQRKLDREQLARVLAGLKKAGIMIWVDHMLGIPGDTIELEEEAIRFYNRHRPDIIYVFWLTYFPGTAIIDIAKDRGLLSAEEIERIYQGRERTDGLLATFHGGSMKNPAPYYGIEMLLNYLPILPRFLVRLLLAARLHRIWRIRSFFLSYVVPRGIITLLNPKYFRGRSHAKRALSRIGERLRGWAFWKPPPSSSPGR